MCMFPACVCTQGAINTHLIEAEVLKCDEKERIFCKFNFPSVSNFRFTGNIITPHRQILLNKQI